MKKIIIILLGIFLLSSCLKPEAPFRCTIYGKVTEDKPPYLPLKGVLIIIESSNPHYTDSLGNYTIIISNLEPREYHIEFILDGYKRDNIWTHKLDSIRELINFQMTKSK